VTVLATGVTVIGCCVTVVPPSVTVSWIMLVCTLVMISTLVAVTVTVRPEGPTLTAEVHSPEDVLVVLVPEELPGMLAPIVGELVVLVLELSGAVERLLGAVDVTASREVKGNVSETPIDSGEIELFLAVKMLEIKALVDARLKGLLVGTVKVVEVSVLDGVGLAGTDEGAPLRIDVAATDFKVEDSDPKVAEDV